MCWCACVAPVALADKRQPCDAAQAKAKIEFDLKMAAYKATCPAPMHTVPDNLGKPAKRKRDPNHPKQPASAFFLFCGQKRDEIKARSMLAPPPARVAFPALRTQRCVGVRGAANMHSQVEHWIACLLLSSPRQLLGPRRRVSCPQATRHDVKSGPQMQSVLGQLWRDMSEAERQPWTEEYSKRKVGKIALQLLRDGPLCGMHSPCCCLA